MEMRSEPIKQTPALSSVPYIFRVRELKRMLQNYAVSFLLYANDTEFVHDFGNINLMSHLLYQQENPRSMTKSKQNY